jgi:hypothetical protein
MRNTSIPPVKTPVLKHPQYENKILVWGPITELTELRAASPSQPRNCMYYYPELSIHP